MKIWKCNPCAVQKLLSSPVRGESMTVKSIVLLSQYFITNLCFNEELTRSKDILASKHSSSVTVNCIYTININITMFLDFKRTKIN